MTIKDLKQNLEPENEVRWPSDSNVFFRRGCLWLFL